MRDQVNYYLDRARAAALAGTLGTPDGGRARHRRASPAPSPRSIATRISRSSWPSRLDLRFRGEKQDLEEMAGNLIDNAAKWASAKVVVEPMRDPRDADRPRFRLLIEDDGPGLPEARAPRC